MLILENIKMALNSLRASKMRALLTMLGIIIGIGSVIAIMTVSSSLTTSISDSFQEMGANNVTVGIRQSSEEEEVSSRGLRFGAAAKNISADEEDYITDEMLDGLKKKFPEEIDAVAISESIGSGTAGLSGSTSNVSVLGINEDYFRSSKISLLAGRKIRKADLTGGKKVMMVSDKVVENLFGGNNESALAQKLSVSLDGNYYDYYIVGI